MGVLNRILTSLPWLSLQNEPNDCIDAFRGFVESLTQEKEDSSTTESRGRGLTLKGHAISALVGLSLQQGRLHHILSALVIMLKSSAFLHSREEAATEKTSSVPVKLVSNKRKQPSSSSDDNNTHWSQRSAETLATAAAKETQITVQIGTYIKLLSNYKGRVRTSI